MPEIKFPKKSHQWLPLGTIVRLKGGEKRIIIIGRAQLIRGDDGVLTLRDYAAVLYPEGYLGPQAMYLFDDEDIEEIISTGFSDSENSLLLDELNKKINSALEEALSQGE